jgi:hypothetical protein
MARGALVLAALLLAAVAVAPLARAQNAADAPADAPAADYIDESAYAPAVEINSEAEAPGPAEEY